MEFTQLKLDNGGDADKFCRDAIFYCTDLAQGEGIRTVHLEYPTPQNADKTDLNHN